MPRRTVTHRQALCEGCGGPVVWADFGSPIGWLPLHNKIYDPADPDARVAVLGPPENRTARFLARGEQVRPGEGRRRLHRDVCPDHFREPVEPLEPQLVLDLDALRSA